MTTVVAVTDSTRPLPPAPHAVSHAQLTESKSGWTLTLILDEDTISAIRRSDPTVAIELKDFTMSISPNLVPGVPFIVGSVQIIAAPST